MYQPGQPLRRLGWIFIAAGSLWLLVSLAAHFQTGDVFQGMLPPPDEANGNQTTGAIPAVLERARSILIDERPQDVAPFAGGLVGIGAILWWIGFARDRQFRKGQIFGKALGVTAENHSEQIRAEMLSLCAQYPGLPPIPIDPLEYDDWIAEARNTAPHLDLTVEQEGRLSDQLNALEGARLEAIQIEKQLRQTLADLAMVKKDAEQRIDSSDEAEAQQAQLCLVNTEAKIAKIQKELRMLKNLRRDSLRAAFGKGS